MQLKGVPECLATSPQSGPLNLLLEQLLRAAVLVERWPVMPWIPRRNERPSLDARNGKHRVERRIHLVEPW